MNVNTTLTLNITCLCYLNNSIFSSNIDMLLTSVSISTTSGAICQKKLRTIISILNQECVLMSIFGGGATISIFNCMCAHVHAWRWHSDTATISILNCVCVLMSMLISTLKLAHVNAWRWHSHNLHLDP